MLGSTTVCTLPLFVKVTTNCLGIGPKVSQSVLTAAFLFAFKDVLYEQTIKLRRKVR
jgi:hypothetical protein